MAQLNLLRENPVVEGMQQAQQLDMQRARADIIRQQAEAAQEKMRQDRAASDALSRIYATGGANMTSADVNRQLSRDGALSGARRLEALKHAEEQDVKRTQVEAQARERQARSFKLYLDSGMYAAAADEAKRMGLNIPPEFWGNKEKIDQLREKLDLDAQRALISQRNASAGASSASAAASRALADQRAPTTYDEYTDAEDRVVRVDKATGKASFVMGPDGQPMRSQNVRRDVVREQQQGANQRNAQTLQSREAIAAGNQSAGLTRTEVQQQGAADRNAATNATREAVATGNQGAALDREEIRQEGANSRAEARNQAGGGRKLAIEVRREYLEEAGYSKQEAAALAAGGAITPGKEAEIKEKIRRSVTNAQDMGRKQFRTPKDQEAEIARLEAGIFGDRRGGARMSPPSREAPAGEAADLPRLADGKIDRSKLVHGQSYLFPLKEGVGSGGQRRVIWDEKAGSFEEAE